MNDNKKTRKRSKKIWIIAGILAVVILAGIFLSISGKGKKMKAKESSTLETTVQKGSLTQTIEGTGTLSNADSSDLKIPAGLKIKKVKVSEGDEVKKGDTLATVDKTSLLAALEETQEELDEINTQLSEEADNDTTKYVKATVDGRVKKIYASKNTSVSDTVLKKGALILISLDGKMAVKIDTTANLTVGQEVSVTLSSGSKVTGTVTKSDDESCTITVTDKGTAYNDKVTAYTSSGKKIGTGRLSINKEAKITATSGTVSSILVSENESVSEGDRLIKLKGDFQSEEYLSLESQKEDLEEKLTSLLKIAKNNTITADSAGVITEVNLSDDTESGTTSTSSSSSGSSSTSSDSSDTSVSSLKTSAVTSGSTTANNAAHSANSNTTTIKAVTLGTNSNRITKKTTDAASAGLMTATAVSTVENDTSTENTEESSESSSEDSSETTTAEEQETTTTQKSDTAKSDTSSNTDKNSSGNTSKNNTTKNNRSSSDSSKTKNSGSQNATTGSGKSNFSNISGASGAMPSAGSSTTAGSVTLDSSSTSSSASTSTSSDTNTELISAFGIASGKKMTLSVDVDEMDILSVKTGQKASIVFDAIEDQTYEGKITSIDKNGSTSNGTTKYPVKIAVTKEDSMMSGMNASVTITTSEISDALLIPSAAVTEEGNTSYVYTQKDSKTGKLSGKTEVEIGDTDGTNVVITSGLSEGDTVYYSMASGTSSDAENTDNQKQDMQMMKDDSFNGGQDSGKGGGTPPSGDAPNKNN